MDATAWNNTYTRNISSSNADGPPSAWFFDGNKVLKTAVDACISENSTGDCKCENGCGSYNGPISAWDVSKMTDMKDLFSNTGGFNADISSWDTSQVTTMHGMWVFLLSFN